MLNREPAVILGVLQAIIALAVSFGLKLSVEQVGTIVAASAAILALVVRQKVLPIGKKNKSVDAVSLMLCAFLLSGCAQLRDANDARKAVCDITGEEQKAQLQGQADRQGVPLDVIWKAWKTSCLFGVKQATDQAMGVTLGTAEEGDCPSE